MAYYEYRCGSCRNKEFIQNVGGPPSEPPECTLCGETTERIYGFGTTNMPTQAGRKMGRK